MVYIRTGPSNMSKLPTSIAYHQLGVLPLRPWRIFCGSSCSLPQQLCLFPLAHPGGKPYLSVPSVHNHNISLAGPQSFSPLKLSYLFITCNPCCCFFPAGSVTGTAAVPLAWQATVAVPASPASCNPLAGPSHPSLLMSMMVMLSWVL